MEPLNVQVPDVFEKVNVPNPEPPDPTNESVLP